VQIKKKSASKANAKSKTLKKVKEVLPKQKQAAKKLPASKVAPRIKPLPEFTMQHVREIVALIKDAGTFTTFGYKTEEFEIEISVGAQNATPQNIYAAQQINSSTPASVVVQTSQTALTLSPVERAIVSPMIGTFYRRPSPNSAPFVDVGDSVTPTTDVCIVEVMKLLNTIPAGCSGTVSRILVEDGATIETGQALMVIEVS
jgi:acetyl-CoA carboxylase biotin carboxyl carrier protein